MRNYRVMRNYRANTPTVTMSIKWSLAYFL